MAVDPVALPKDGSRTILWCVPRSCSTALTKCLTFIEGIEVWFEPYTYCRIATVNMKQQLGVDLPVEYHGNEEVYKRLADHCRATGQGNVIKPENLSYASIGRMLEQSSSTHVLVKDMSLALSPDQYKFIPKGFKHIFLIRHPLRVYTSLRKALFAQLSALGLLAGSAAVEETFDIAKDYPYANPGTMVHKDVYDMWKYVTQHLGSESIVVDSDDLLTNPAGMVPKICRAAGLPYDESLLKWDGSSEVVKRWVFSAEGVVEMLSHFFNTAINSSEFIPASKMPSRDEVRPDVLKCTDQVMKYYEEMYEVRLKV